MILDFMRVGLNVAPEDAGTKNAFTRCTLESIRNILIAIALRMTTSPPKIYTPAGIYLRVML